MKIYWGLRPSPAKVAERITALERELGLDDQTVLAEVEQQKLKRFNSKRGPVLLRPPPPPMRLLHSSLEDLDISPGMKWPVADAESVQFLVASAVSSNFHQIVRTPKSRVVLPDGVRV